MQVNQCQSCFATMQPGDSYCGYCGSYHTGVSKGFSLEQYVAAYDKYTSRSIPVPIKWNLSPSDWTECLDAIIDQFRNGAPVNSVYSDWGCTGITFSELQRIAGPQ